MKQKRATSKQELSPPTVSLKPFLGMQPGVYLTILYGFLFIIALFLLLFFPGIRKNGTYYSFNTNPGNVSVYIDDSFAGTSPLTLFIKRGTHVIDLKKSFYKTSNETVKVKGKVFGTIFAPRREKYLKTLLFDDPAGYLSEAHKDFSRWALVNTFYSSYQPPPVIQQAVLNYTLPDPNGAATAYPELLNGFLLSSMRGVSNQVILKDFLKASLLNLSGGNAMTPSTLLDSFSDLTDLAANPVFPIWLYQSLSPDYRALLEKDSVFLNLVKNYIETLKKSSDVPKVSGIPFNFEGGAYISIKGGDYTMGVSGALPSPAEMIANLKDNGTIPAAAAAPDLMVHSTEITKREYIRFIAENPQWSAENLDNLVSRKMVTEDYLKNWYETAPEDPVTCVSFYAAEAYCGWLTSKLPPSLSGYTVRLPKENEWEWLSLADSGTSSVFLTRTAAGPYRVLASGKDTLGLYGLMGNVWEWCSNWYYPFPYITEGAFTNPADDPWEGAEKAVRGGSWANEVETVENTSRGFQPPEWCTPFLGFRPVIVKE